MTRFVSCAVLLAFVATLAGCSGGGGGGSTPQATFDNFKSAMQAKDYKKGFAQTTPESQEAMLGVMALGASMVAMFDQEKGAEVQKMLDKHGLKMDGPPGAGSADPQAAMKELTAGVKDKPACIAEIMTWMEKNKTGDNSKANPGEEFASAELIDVKIDGDTATGKVKTKAGGTEETKPAHFKKVGDVWLIDFAKEMQQPQLSPGSMPPFDSDKPADEPKP